MQGNTQNFDFAVETEYVDEVLARAKTECSALILQGGTRIQRTTNENCHICHTRKPIGGIFPCGNPRHNYCEFHFQVSYLVLSPQIQNLIIAKLLSSFL
jgi:hypothetical protein